MTKFIFYINSPYMGADVKEEVEIDIEGLSENQADKLIEREFQSWICEYAGWRPADDEETD